MSYSIVNASASSGPVNDITTIVAYAPTDFATTASTAAMVLHTTADNASASSTATAATLPAGTQIVNARLFALNDLKAGANALSAGVGVGAPGASTLTNNIFNGVNISSAQAGIYANFSTGVWAQGTAAGPGTVGFTTANNALRIQPGVASALVANGKSQIGLVINVAGVKDPNRQPAAGC